MRDTQEVLKRWLAGITHQPSKELIRTLLDDGWAVVGTGEQIVIGSPQNKVWIECNTWHSGWGFVPYHRLTYLKLTQHYGRISSQFISEGHVPWETPPGFRSASFKDITNMLERERLSGTHTLTAPEENSHE
jgi:hypothetical protein